MNYKIKDILYLSNILSLLRIFLLIPLILLFENSRYYFAIALSIIIILTDYFDGYFARKFDKVSDLGKILDPLADKIAIIIMVVYLGIVGKVPIWFICTIIIRDLIVFTGGIIIKKSRNIVVQSNLLGKLTTTVISLYFLVCIFDFIIDLKQIMNILLFVSLAFLVISTTIYTNIFFSKMNEE